MRRVLAFAVLAMGLMFSAPLTAQTTGLQQGLVLTIDSERLFLASDFGKRVAAEVEAAGNDLVAENRRIEAELAEAEQELTDMRATMTPEAFRPLADAFDTRVQETRQAQAAKSRALNAQLDSEREVFLNAAGPVLEVLMQELGASVVLERRTVFISANSSDITAEAVTRLNETLGAGATTPVVPDRPQPAPAQD
tara:strand:+ start:31063 stop:31647 length:585 start_codon:yes stop_codon:yes gene_type:complete